MSTPIRVRKRMPVSGLVTALPEDVLPDEASPRCLNVRFRFGEVIPRPGSKLFSDKQVAESVLHIDEFSRIDALVWLLHLTETKIYRFGDTLPGVPRDWFAISGGPTIVSGRRWSVTKGEGLFFFTHGQEVLTWSGTGSYASITDADTSGIFASEIVSSRYIEYFNNSLILGYVEEASGTKANRIRWSINGDHTRWDDTAGLGAGFIDLFEEGEEPITGLRALHDRLVVYKRRSFAEILATGTLTPRHIVQVRSRGIGCAAPYTLAFNGFVHFFMGVDGNVYAWDSNTLSPIGDPILNELEGLVDPANFDTIFGAAIPSRQEYWLVVDSDNVFVYDWYRNTWSRDSYPSLSALGEADDTFGIVVWNDAIGAWDVYGGQWNQQNISRQIKAFGGRATGEIFEVDKMTVDDYFAIGSIVDRHVETPDFYFSTSGDYTGPWQQGTIQQLLLTYKYENSEPFEVGVSLDRGLTWNTQLITPVPAGYSALSFNLTGNVVRFRFRENNSQGRFRWRNFDYEFVPAGPFRG